MKAFLLAAGYGTRLRPLTENTAKCLVRINGQPLLAWWLKLLKKNNVNQVLVNTHYLSEQVIEYADNYNKENGKFVVTIYEEVLLGSGGTIKNNLDFIGEDEDFIICYADNLTNINLKKMYEFHKTHKGILTMAMFYTNKPTQCGIVELDENNRIVNFEEKPINPKSNLANAGIYIVRKELVEYLLKDGFSDFGKDVLPLLVGKMYGYQMSEYLIDIGTMDNYKKAQEEWQYDYYEDTI